MKTILMFIFLKCGIFPADCSDLKVWEDFAGNSSRNAVERLYWFWRLCFDLKKKAHRNVESILRKRLQCFERPCAEVDFVERNKNKICFVHPTWSAQEISEYVRQNPPAAYPFYVIDSCYQVCGIAINKELVLVGVLNFPTSVDDAQRLYVKCNLKPLTDEDAELVLKSDKVRRMMQVAGMPKINGLYLLVNKETQGWYGSRLGKNNILASAKDYFLFAKL